MTTPATQPDPTPTTTGPGATCDHCGRAMLDTPGCDPDTWPTVATYGTEPGWPDDLTPPDRCRDCGAHLGHHHHPGCCVAVCIEHDAQVAGTTVRLAGRTSPDLAEVLGETRSASVLKRSCVTQSQLSRMEQFPTVVFALDLAGPRRTSPWRGALPHRPDLATSPGPRTGEVEVVGRGHRSSTHLAEHFGEVSESSNPAPADDRRSTTSMTDQPKRGPWASIEFDSVTFMLATFVRGADAARRAGQAEAAEQLERLAALAADELQARGKDD